MMSDDLVLHIILYILIIGLSISIIGFFAYLFYKKTNYLCTKAKYARYYLLFVCILFSSDFIYIAVVGHNNMGYPISVTDRFYCIAVVCFFFAIGIQCFVTNSKLKQLLNIFIKKEL